MTILVTDIRNFTTISEALTPKENFNFLNSFLARMVPIIRKHGGLIDKYMGDGVMGLFPDECIKAVDSAVELQETITMFNKQKVFSGVETINIGISIHFGSLMLGTIGETNRMDATVISDAVNLSFRLEALTKYYKCGIIISQDTKDRIKDCCKYHCRFIDIVKVKGKSKAVKIYEVLEGDIFRDKKIETLDLYNEAIEYYNNNDFKMALNLFNKLLEIHSSDKTAIIYKERCTQNIGDD